MQTVLPFTARCYSSHYVFIIAANELEVSPIGLLPMSDTVICSGPLPSYRGDEISRLLSLNGWMSKWCPQNNIGFIDNWTSFWGRPDLLKRDGLHPSWGGATILSRNMAHTVLELVFD